MTQLQPLTLADDLPDAPDVMAFDINDPLVARAAQFLIARRRQGQAFDIQAFAPPHEALADISGQLEDAGMSMAMADPLVEALRRYVMASGGSFSRAANAKPVMIRLVVTDAMPDRRFENGVTELAALGPHEVKVEGAARVNVRITPTGTGTTSNAADVDAMFANVKGTFLWVRFEAPTKEDLEGLLSSVESTLAAVAQSVGGAMGAAEFKELLEILQKDGALTPAVTVLIQNLIKLQEGMTGGPDALSSADIAALTAEMGELIETAMADGVLPPALVQAVMASLAEFSSSPAIATLMVEQGFADMIADNDNLTIEQQIAELVAQVEALAEVEGIDPALATQITEMIETLQAQLEAGEVTPAAMLETLGEKLTAIAAQADVPPALFEGIGAILPDIAVLRENPQVVEASSSAAADIALPLEQGEALLAVLEEVAAQVQAGEIDIADLPPELQALIEKMGGVETLLLEEGRELRIETLAEAMTSEGDPAMAETVQAAVLVMASAQGLESLPPQTVEAIQTFIAENPAVVETAATQTVIRDMQATLAEIDPASPEAAEIEAAIEILKAEGLQALIDKAGDAPLPPAVEKAVESFVKDNPEVAAIVTEYAATKPSAPEGAAPQAQEQPQAEADAPEIETPEAEKTGAERIESDAPASEPIDLDPPAVVSLADTILPAEGDATAAEPAQPAAPSRTFAVESASANPSASDSSFTAPALDIAGEGNTMTVSTITAPSLSDTAPPLIPPQVTAGLQTLAVQLAIPAQGTGTIPAAQKAAQTLVQQALADIQKINPASPPTAAQATPLLQKLVDAQAKLTDPQQKVEINKVIEQLRGSVSDPNNLLKDQPPSDKPGCNSICNCFDKLPEKATPEIIQQMRQDMAAYARPNDNPTPQNPQIEVRDNGDMVVRENRDGPVRVIKYEEFRASQIANTTAMESLKNSGFMDKTASVAELEEALKGVHICGVGCNDDFKTAARGTVTTSAETALGHAAVVSSDIKADAGVLDIARNDKTTQAMNNAFAFAPKTL